MLLPELLPRTRLLSMLSISWKVLRGSLRPRRTDSLPMRVCLWVLALRATSLTHCPLSSVDVAAAPLLPKGGRNNGTFLGRNDGSDFKGTKGRHDFKGGLMDGYLHVHYVHCPRHHLLQNTQFALLLPRKFRKKQERETGLRDRYHHATDYLSTSPRKEPVSYQIS